MPKSSKRGNHKFYRHFANGAAPVAPAAFTPTAAPAAAPAAPAAPAPQQTPAPAAAPQAPAQDDFLMFDGPETGTESPIGVIPDEQIVALQMSTRYYQVAEQEQ